MRKNKGLSQDLAIIVVSIIVAVLLVETKTLTNLFVYTADWGVVNSFIAGFFFTSVFTTAPAIAAFGELALTGPLPEIAFFGALGAMCGDFLIFAFLRDRFSDHITETLKERGAFRRLRKVFKLKFFKQFTFLVGGLIIASPLPDELGLSLLGFSKVKTSWLLVLSFTFNFLGIYLVGLAARALV